MKSNGKMRIFIADSPCGWDSDVYITIKHDDGSMDIAQPMELVFKHYEAKDIEGSVIADKPTLKLSHIIKHDFLDSLYEAFKRYGFNPWTESKMEGTLESTKRHLEDLRYLLKLPKELVEVKGGKR